LRPSSRSGAGLARGRGAASVSGIIAPRGCVRGSNPP